MTVTTALWGGFIISLLIVSVNDIFILSVPQKIAYDKLIRVRTAVKCIIAALRYQVAKQKYRAINGDGNTEPSRSTHIREDNVDKVRQMLT